MLLLHPTLLLLFFLLTLLHFQNTVFDLLFPCFSHAAEVATQSLHLRHIFHDVRTTLELSVLFFVVLSVTPRSNSHVVNLS